MPETEPEPGPFKGDETIKHVNGQGEDTVCPVCSRALVMEHGEAVCRSGMCHFRVVEDCC